MAPDVVERDPGPILCERVDAAAIRGHASIWVRCRAAEGPLAPPGLQPDLPDRSQTPDLPDTEASASYEGEQCYVDPFEALTSTVGSSDVENAPQV